MSVPFAEQVAAVTPLNGVIDGSPKPKRRRVKPLRRERMDASHTFFCRNANCDHATWSPIEQARHMHAEFVWAMEALVLRAPESPEALLLTGGVTLAELTDDECRAGAVQAGWAKKHGMEISAELRLRSNEYQRRRNLGILVFASAPTRRAPLREACPSGHPYSGDNLFIQGGSRRCRECRREGERRHRRERSASWRKARACEICGRQFTPQRKNAKICGDGCRQARQREHERQYRARKRAEATEVT